MSLQEIINIIQQNPNTVPIIIVILMSILEISKIKINPWSMLGHLIGRFLGLNFISDKIDALEKKVDENQATTIRVRILRFEDDLQAQKKCSKDSWNQVMDDIRRYKEYVDTHPEFMNEITTASINHIRKSYSEHLEKADW